MASRTLVGTSASAQYKICEKVDSDRQLYPKDSGKVFFIEKHASDDFIVNLPTLSSIKPGWHATFIQQNTQQSSNVGIASYGSAIGGTASTVDDEKVIVGPSFAATDADATTDAGCEGIKLGTGSDQNDHVVVSTNGTNWFMQAYVHAAANTDVING